MKLRRQKTSQSLQVVGDNRQFHVRRPYVIPILGLLLGLAIVGAAILTNGSSPTFRPSSSHVVFLFDNGKQETLDTKATTVGDLVNKLPLNLIPQDVVEPSRDTPIFDDNFRINIYRARPVTIVDGNTRTVTLTAQKSARQVAEDAGLKINSEDIATFAQGNLAENVIGEQVIVARATPVTLNLYGSQVPTYTQAKTVHDFLQEKHIKLENGETVAPVIKTPITPGMLIFVLAKGTQVITKTNIVPAPVQSVADSSLSFGTTAVRQTGQAGKKVDTYLITDQNGKQVAQKLIQEVVVQDPVAQIVAVGTTIDIDSAKVKVMAAAGISAGDYQYVDYIVSRESGWCPTKLQGQVGYCPASPPDSMPSYLGYGLGQATPGGKMASAGSDWETNPVTQLKWATGYADGRYGSWGAAYNHWVANHNW